MTWRDFDGPSESALTSFGVEHKVLQYHLEGVRFRGPTFDHHGVACADPVTDVAWVGGS